MRPRCELRCGRIKDSWIPQLAIFKIERLMYVCVSAASTTSAMLKVMLKKIGLYFISLSPHLVLSNTDCELDKKRNWCGVPQIPVHFIAFRSLSTFIYYIFSKSNPFSQILMLFAFTSESPHQYKFPLSFSKFLTPFCCISFSSFSAKQLHLNRVQILGHLISLLTLFRSLQ